MGGTFNSLGTGNAYRKDPIAEQHRAQLEHDKAASYQARVIGRRVVVVADVDFGKPGEIVGVADGLLMVQLDDEREPHFFARHELQVAR